MSLHLLVSSSQSCGVSTEKSKLVSYSSSLLVYIIANELVSLLKAFGVMFGLSDAILGLTVLAWGNSIGDMIADTSMAKRGAPRVGYSACFGGPLFNLLIGIGLPFTIQILQGGGKTISLGGCRDERKSFYLIEIFQFVTR